jgi:hypothetical protein
VKRNLKLGQVKVPKRTSYTYFNKSPVSWNKIEKQQQFFEDFAHNNQFDPKIPENWYLQSIDKIMSTKVAPSPLPFHNKTQIKMKITTGSTGSNCVPRQ